MRLPILCGDGVEIAIGPIATVDVDFYRDQLPVAGGVVMSTRTACTS
jgi:hypothetical protein